MYPTSEEVAVIKAAEDLMVEVMARYDPSHDTFHVERVRKTALSLALLITTDTCKPDLLTVELSAILHDVLDKKYVTAEQADDPYTYFLPFFQKNASDKLDLVADGRARHIADIVSNVSWTTEMKLRAQEEWTMWHDSCVELHCVQDADRLDAIGAFGVMRCAAYSAVINRPLHSPPSNPNFESAIGHFNVKLLQIKDRLKTEPGRKMGEKRHQTLIKFLHDIDEEFDARVPA